MRQAPELAFTLSEYATRLNKVRSVMAERGIDVLLTQSPENIYYICGYNSVGYYKYTALILPLEGDLTLLANGCESSLVRTSTWLDDTRTWPDGADPVAATIDILRERELANRRIGLEENGWFFRISQYRTLTAALSGEATFVDASTLVAEMRLVKSPLEIAYVRRAAEIADAGYLAALAVLREGVKESDVGAAVYYAHYKAGGDPPGLPLTLGSGYRSSHLHGTPSEKVIELGDAVPMEVVGSYRHYNTNLLRTPVIGQPADRVVEAYDLLRESVMETTAAARPGVPVADLDRISRRVTARYDKYRTHRTGYGLEAGFPPASMGHLSISAADPHVLEPGMVFSIEPTFTFYDQDPPWGVMCGHCVLVTETGCEVLHKSTMELIRR